MLPCITDIRRQHHKEVIYNISCGDKYITLVHEAIHDFIL